MTSDKAKAVAFLLGRDHEHLPQEHQAALVRLLRDAAPLDTDVRNALASAIDENGASAYRLVRKRRQGRPSNSVHEALKAQEVFRVVEAQLAFEVAKAAPRKNGLLKVAVLEVAMAMDLNPEAVRKAYQRGRRAKVR